MLFNQKPRRGGSLAVGLDKSTPYISSVAGPDGPKPFCRAVGHRFGGKKNYVIGGRRDFDDNRRFHVGTGVKLELRVRRRDLHRVCPDPLGGIVDYCPIWPRFGGYCRLCRTRIIGRCIGV